MKLVCCKCIKTKHNSNHKTPQTTLNGEIIREYTYFCLGFVPAEELGTAAWIVGAGAPMGIDIDAADDLDS